MTKANELTYNYVEEHQYTENYKPKHRNINQ